MLRRIRALTTFAFFIFAVKANAVFPICSRASLSSKVRDVLVPVRHYGPVDRRGRLSEKVNEFELTPKEVAQIKKSFGIFFCEDVPGKPSVSGGFLAQNNCEIWLTGHALQKKDGTPRDLTKCRFQNFEIPGQRTSIVADSKRNIIPWVVDEVEGRVDRARLRLKACIPGATPFLVEDVKVQEGTRFISIMADNWDIPMGNEPILSPGRVEGIKTFDDQTRVLLTSNDQDAGASGGIVVVRSRGKLAVRAIHVQMTFPLKTYVEGQPPDGSPYDQVLNSNRDLEISGPVYKALTQP